ncbi:C40 family peptidase [Streptomyces sp. P38-E01]|uniref:C40 family peptidase n=1 Tax=Streptomyces tardus TaxID=2780544 RepID=A0A949JDT7_9ACTN|nr:C40 family peptidase [Streptomyces tardus]MBU7598217.1 C40 family peptidase [Streptomyces tardus]
MIRRGTVLVCALTVLLVPAGGVAYAEPSPSPGTRDPSPPADDPENGDGGSGSGSDEADGTDEPVEIDPELAKRLEKVRKEIDKLHDQAGSATDAYNAAAVKVKKQEKAIADLARKIENNEGRLQNLSNRAGAMARAQYRGVGLPVSSRFTLERDPEKFLRSVGLLYKGQQATKGVINRLDSTQKSLRGSAKKAAEHWAKLEAGRKKRASAKKEIQAKLKKAEKLEADLAEEERELLLDLEDDAAHRRQLEWLRSGVLEEITAKASKKGKRALAFALDQIGKDYKWGATGPGTFDCSGLTLRAWESAGLRIPRTSQAQWAGLDRVKLTSMRPGDLIIYKGDASHVGMYVGEGTMVHAPRTGRQIRVEGVGALPIKGIVRPDA